MPSPQLVVDFVNSMACPGCRVDDAFATERAFARWSLRHLPDRLRADGDFPLPRLRRLRAATVELLRATQARRAPSLRAVQVVNSLAKLGLGPPRLAWAEGSWTLARPPSRRGRAGGPEVPIALAVQELLCSPLARQLRPCQGSACVHFLLARNRTQKWCSPTGCGNRARVARHYRRTRPSRAR